jgi:inner membrane transporter RhtA
MNSAFYASLAYLPIGVAVTIEFIGPLTLAAVLSRRVRDLAAVAAAGLGVALVSGALDASWGRFPPIGIGYAALAGAMWAAYIVLSQRTGRAFAGLDGLALALVVATAAVTPFGVTTAGHWTPGVLGLGLGIAVLSSVLPYSLELMALRHLSPRVFGVLLSLEPAFAALAGLLVLHQVLDLPQLAGMALVVAASTVVLGSQSRPSSPEPAIPPG